MPSPDAPPLTRGVVLRGIGFAAAIVLGAIAVWLIVTSTSQKRIEIGILTGLWGLLLGAYSMFGARRTPGADGYDEPNREVTVREARAIERGDDAQARRDWEARLERLIQREISTTVSRETAALRNEIAHLRQDLVEKVGGQIRLERIETTRVIGSDLEALQHEVRQLKVASGNLGVKEILAQAGDQRIAVRQVVEPARIRPVSRPTAEVEADIRPALREEPAAPSANQPIGQRTAQAAPARTASSAAPRREPAAERPAAPARVEPVRVAPAQRPGTPTVPAAAAPVTSAPPVQPRRQAPVTPPASAPVRAANRTPPVQDATPTKDATPVRDAAPAKDATPPASPPPASPPAVRTAAPRDADPFADLPRIRPFTDFALDPTPSTAPAGPPPRINGTPRNGTPRNGTPANATPANGDHGAANAAGLYTGRRRRTDGDAAVPGKHSGPAATPAVTAPPAAAASTPAPAATTPAPAATQVAAGPSTSRADGPDQTEGAGGRRRRTDGHDDGSDLLARLLARESVDR